MDFQEINSSYPSLVCLQENQVHGQTGLFLGTCHAGHPLEGAQTALVCLDGPLVDRNAHDPQASGQIYHLCSLSLGQEADQNLPNVQVPLHDQDVPSARQDQSHLDMETYPGAL